MPAGADFESFWVLGARPGPPRVAMTPGDTSPPAEAVDEAMVRACARWERLSGYESPAGWLYRVAWNWAVSQRRKLAVRPLRRIGRLDLPDAVRAKR